jgi:hypothetical protein
MWETEWEELQNGRLALLNTQFDEREKRKQPVFSPLWKQRDTEFVDDAIIALDKHEKRMFEFLLERTNDGSTENNRWSVKEILYINFKFGLNHSDDDLHSAYLNNLKSRFIK